MTASNSSAAITAFCTLSVNESAQATARARAFACKGSIPYMRQPPSPGCESCNFPSRNCVMVVNSTLAITCAITSSDQARSSNFWVSRSKK
ncbi:MAG: hypothetical protein C0391_05540 [Anaerolinea sp.]|nr:hypothetical protein [Anaerolinea sp.]